MHKASDCGSQCSLHEKQIDCHQVMGTKLTIPEAKPDLI